MKEENSINHQIFYLLGAGASVMQDKYSNKACLPLADDFVEKFDTLRFYSKDKTSSKYPRNTENILTSINNKIIKLKDAIDEFLKEISKFGTIDEAMRYYYLNNNTSQFNEFKHTISTIFYIFENIEQFRDPRYKQFLMTLIEDKKFTLPENIKILSWNYDNQFEHACNEIQDNHNKANILNNDNYIKINGSAFFQPKNLNPLILEGSKFQTEIEDFQNFNKNTNKIDFAWEEEFKSKFYKRLENIEKIKSEKAILVVIGYSFPFINHKYDLEILETINPSMVYYQNIFDQTEVLQERFGKTFKFINDCNRFYIPKEMYDGYNKNNGKYFITKA